MCSRQTAAHVTLQASGCRSSGLQPAVTTQISTTEMGLNMQTYSCLLFDEGGSMSDYTVCSAFSTQQMRVWQQWKKNWDYFISKPVERRSCFSGVFCSAAAGSFSPSSQIHIFHLQSLLIVIFCSSWGFFHFFPPLKYFFFIRIKRTEAVISTF